MVSVFEVNESKSPDNLAYSVPKAVNVLQLILYAAKATIVTHAIRIAIYKQHMN